MGREADVPRTIPGGTPVPDGTSIFLHRLTDLVTPVATLSMSSGKYEHEYDGSYGPIQTKFTYNSETRIRDSLATGQSGAINFGDLPFWIRGQGNGITRNDRNLLQVIAGAPGRKVYVRNGSAAGAGIIYNQFTDNKESPEFAENTSGLPRVDTLVVRLYTPGHDEEGRAELAILQGTPAATPVSVALTQTAENGIWEESLAWITLANGYSSIVTGNITDTRRFAFDETIYDTMAQVLLAGPGISLFESDTNNLIQISAENHGVTVRTASLAIANGNSSAFAASCVGSEIATGGGFHGNTASSLIDCWASVPQGTQHLVGFSNLGTGGDHICTAYVVCLAQPS